MGKIADALDKIDALNGLNTLQVEAEELQELPERGISSQSVDPPQPIGSPQPIVSAQPTASVQPAESAQPVAPSINSKKLPDIAEVSGKWDERLFKAVNSDTVLPEVFKTLRSKILHPLGGRPVAKTIMISSAIPQEGKSFVTSNLAISFATGMDQHCLLIDCDLRHPSLSRMFGIKRKFGLVDYLRDNIELSSLILKSSVQKLSILPSGQTPQNPAELLSSTRMEQLIQEVSSRYQDRIVIFDSPPMLMAAESIVLAGHVDAVILVIRQGRSKKDEVQKFIDTVGEEKIIGIVFNDHTMNYQDQSLVQGYGY